jgi:hypothetical protein
MVVNQRPGIKIKALAAIVGGGALITLGAVSALSEGGSPAAPAVVSAGEMTVGDTATAAYSATEETSMAVPGDKAPPPCGFNSGC